MERKEDYEEQRQKNRAEIELWLLKITDEEFVKLEIYAETLLEMVKEAKKFRKFT